ncbi:MAG: ABC transporter permease [Trichloromonadaceae bacterium]
MKAWATLIQAWRLARRELRTGLHGFGVFLGCLFLGVFAISAIGSFTAAAQKGLLADASALLGGDLEVAMTHRPLSAEQEAFLRQRGAVSTVLELRSMVRSLADDQRALVELKAVDDSYPLYGQILSNPAQPLTQALEARDGHFGALAEVALLQRLQLQVGDSIQLGEAFFTLRGVLTREPDRNVGAFSLGPRLLVSQAGLEASELLQPGSLVSYAYRIRLPQREGTEALRQQLQTQFPDAGWRLRSWQEAAPRVRYFLERMNLNLTLVGLCALLVGGLGVAGAVRGYLAGKVLHIATLKCLGAPAAVIFLAYLLQVLLLGGLGSGLGLVGGAALPWLLAWLIGDRLPVPLAPGLFPEVLLSAALFGLLTALVFSLKPLGSARRVSPALLFRGYSLSGSEHPGRWVQLAIALSACLLAALAVTTASDQRLALWFIAGVLVCFGLFQLLARMVIRLAARLPRPAQPALRLGLGNIHRRGAPAASAIFSLGLGLTALVMITQVQSNLRALVDDTLPRQAPAYFILDLQPDQVAAFDALAKTLPEVERSERYPTLRGRITAIAGVPVEQAQIAPEVQWAVRGDRYLSYAGELPNGSSLSAGAWWATDYQGPALVSLTADLAKGFGVGIGDTISVNVLGREISARIAALREVDWSTLELNFALLFAPGLLESAPQTHLAAIHVPPAGEAAVFRAVTQAFPNVSVIGTREVLSNVTLTLQRIGAAFTAMASLVLISGLLVLAGAVSSDQHRRIHDAVIFKVCGATRRDILAAFAAEFLLLGLCAGLLAALIGSLAAWGVLEGLMDSDFTLAPLALLGTLAAGLAATLLLGLLGTWKALGQKPAALLRED